MTSLTDQGYWERLAASAIRLKQPADAVGIARLCVAAQERGETASAWHMAAQFYGYPERCNCQPCAIKRAS